MGQRKEKQMLLKDLLPYVSLMEDVRIFCFDNYIDNEKEENYLLYEGSVLNIPWIYLDCALDSQSEDGEKAIATSHYTNKHQVVMSRLDICITEVGQE